MALRSTQSRAEVTTSIYSPHVTLVTMASIQGLGPPCRPSNNCWWLVVALLPYYFPITHTAQANLTDHQGASNTAVGTGGPAGPPTPCPSRGCGTATVASSPGKTAQPDCVCPPRRLPGNDRPRWATPGPRVPGGTHRQARMTGTAWGQAQTKVMSTPLAVCWASAGREG